MSVFVILLYHLTCNIRKVVRVEVTLDIDDPLVVQMLILQIRENCQLVPLG